MIKQYGVGSASISYPEVENIEDKGEETMDGGADGTFFQKMKTLKNNGKV